MGSTTAVARGLRAALLAAALLAAPLAADATAFEWRGGLFSLSGVPNPLAPPDTALMLEPGAAPVFDVDFINKSIFSYRDSNLVFGSGVTVINDVVWMSLDDHGLLRTGAILFTPKFINNGLFLKTGGGPTLIVNVDFVNSGVIRSDAGVIGLNTPEKTFNAGSQLLGVGAGKIEIRNGGVFNGEFKSSNLELVHGTYRGNDAQIAVGSRLDWTSGTFTGSWTNVGAITARDTGGVRHFGDGVRFANDGAFIWQSGEVTLGNGAQLTNRQLYEVRPSVGTVATAFNWISGATRPTFTNLELFLNNRIDDRVGSTLHIGDVHFVNHGIVRAAGDEGDVINFNGFATFESGTRFEGNAGTVRINHDATFKGGISSGGATLLLSSGRFTGIDARTSGSVFWRGGTLAETWSNGGLLHLSAGSSQKRVEGNLINEGRISWFEPASDALILGRAGTPATILNRGDFDSLPDSGITNEIRPEPGAVSRILNTGTFTHAGLGQTRVGVPFENLGKVDVRDGTMRFDNELKQTGLITRIRDAVLVVPGGTVNLGTIAGFRLVNLRTSGEGVLINRGHIVPGESPGTLLIEGGYIHGADGVLDIELQDITTFDRLIIDGDADLLGGELALHCFALCDLDVGDSIDFLDVGGELTGSFAALTLHGFGDGWRFGVEYDYDADRVRLRVLEVGAPPPAPVNEPGASLLVLLALVALSAARLPIPRAIRGAD